MKWLKRLLCVGTLVIGLALGPLFMNQGYYFLPDVQPTMTIEWTKNPIKPIKNYANGVEADIHYISEVDHNVQMAGEVFCEWESRRVFPFGYWHDPVTDKYLVGFLPIKPKARATILFVADREGQARMILTMLYARIKGIQVMIEEDPVEEPIRNISIQAKTPEILTVKNVSFQCKCDVLLAKVVRVGEGYEMSYYDMKFLFPGDTWKVSMQPGDYAWQIECWDTKNDQPLPVQQGGLRFPSPGIDDEITIDCTGRGKTL